jgi:hypothetical protein
MLEISRLPPKHSYLVSNLLGDSLIPSIPLDVNSTHVLLLPKYYLGGSATYQLAYLKSSLGCLTVISKITCSK